MRLDCRPSESVSVDDDDDDDSDDDDDDDDQPDANTVQQAASLLRPRPVVVTARGHPTPQRERLPSRKKTQFMQTQH